MSYTPDRKFIAEIRNVTRTGNNPFRSAGWFNGADMNGDSTIGSHTIIRNDFTLLSPTDADNARLSESGDYRIRWEATVKLLVTTDPEYVTIACSGTNGYTPSFDQGGLGSRNLEDVVRGWTDFQISGVDYRSYMLEIDVSYDPTVGAYNQLHAKSFKTTGGTKNLSEYIYERIEITKL